MIVRADPRPARGWGQPITYRERHYVQAAYRAGYSTNRMRRFLGGNWERLAGILDTLGLPRRSRVKKPSIEQPALVELPQALLWRCQQCEAITGRPSCPCGWSV